MPKLARTLKVGCYGTDVYAAKRTVAKGLKDGPVKEGKVGRTFGPFFRTRVNNLRKKFGMKQTGVFDQPMLDRCVDEGLVDNYSEWLFSVAYKARVPAPIPPAYPLEEPYQGFDSLSKILWPLYSVGIKMGLRDGPGTASGTYNPASRLPSGRKSDHAYYPARAFDLDTTKIKSAQAWKYFNHCVGKPEVEYVIYETKIWSRSRGLHTYTAGGHGDHVHVSQRG